MTIEFMGKYQQFGIVSLYYSIFVSTKKKNGSGVHIHGKLRGL